MFLFGFNDKAGVVVDDGVVGTFEELLGLFALFSILFDFVAVVEKSVDNVYICIFSLLM